MSKKEKIIVFFGIITIVLIVLCVLFFIVNKSTTDIEVTNVEVSKLKELPKPQITGGQRGELGIDKNINESTIDEYLNREDSVYRDMRMLEDPGNYENIGGDRFLSGYIEGFEVIPLPYIIPVTGLPTEVGDTYTGTTLFYNDNGTYIANYEESMDIIKKIFPKDKIIFLMCGGGGYAGMTKNFLVSLGWDENKIYNVGGYWYYKGEHSINIKKEVNGIVSYNFDSVPYYDINFNKLTKSANYKAPIIKVTEIKINTSEILLEEGTSFQLNAIVLPNETTNKEVKWTSNNEMVATVTNEGLVRAIGAGNAIITVQSVNGNKTALCKVTVNKKEISTRIKLDDVSKEAKEFESYSFETLSEAFGDKVNSPENVEKYYIIKADGSKESNNLWKEEYRKHEEELRQGHSRRAEILDKLIDDKKSFIVLIANKDCEQREYSVLYGAEEILKQNNYSYFELGTPVTDGDETLSKSKLNIGLYNGGSIAIIKNGELYVRINPDVDAIKNEEELKNWLSKYIEIK